MCACIAVHVLPVAQYFIQQSNSNRVVPGPRGERAFLLLASQSCELLYLANDFESELFMRCVQRFSFDSRHLAEQVVQSEVQRLVLAAA